MCTWATASPTRRALLVRMRKERRRTTHRMRCHNPLLVVMQQAEDVVLREARAALEEVQLHGEGQPGNLAAQLTHQLDGGLHGAAGSQQVIDQHYALAGLNRV